MEFNIDLSTVPELKTIPDGAYIGRVVSVEERGTSTGGKKLTFCIEIEAPQEQKDEVGKIYMDFPTKDAEGAPSGALFRLKQFSRCFGDVPVGTFDPELWVGKRFGWVCTIEDTLEFGVRNRETVFLSADQVTPVAKRTQADVDKLVENNQQRKAEAGVGDASGAGVSGGGGAGEGGGAPF